MAIALEYSSPILVIVLYNVQHKSAVILHAIKTNVLSKSGLTVQMITNVLRDIARPARELVKLHHRLSLVLER